MCVNYAAKSAGVEGVCIAYIYIYRERERKRERDFNYATKSVDVEGI
jgi:hypothetical protein